MKFIILGCGSSMGVPRADGFFGNCDPKNKKNYRTRCSALLKTTDENVLIDTSPDLRQQLLRHKITKIDKVFYSHIHSDQTHGINDLRIFYIKNRKQIDVYADLDTSNYLKKSFSYCFNSYSKERESGRLKLLLTQGISLKKLVFAKIYSIWLIGFCLLFITLIIQFIFNSSLLDSDTIFRLILLIISYNIYYLIIINL